MISECKEDRIAVHIYTYKAEPSKSVCGSCAGVTFTISIEEKSPIWEFNKSSRYVVFFKFDIIFMVKELDSNH